MKHLLTRLTLPAFAVLVIAAGCESSVPSAAELDTAPLYGTASKAAVRPDPLGPIPIDSTGFMTVEKDTSGWE
jgi:hypothetical protein